VDLVLGARPRADQLRPSGQAPAHRADALIGRPDAVELARPQQPGQRACVEAVGLGARLADAGIAGRDDDHPRDVRLDDPRDRPGVARHFQRDPVVLVEALREQLELVGLGLDAPGRPQSALSDDRHLAKIAVDVQRDRSHLVLLVVVDSGRTGGQTTSTDPRSQRNRASRTGGH
jgi:hypothetical protein